MSVSVKRFGNAFAHQGLQLDAEIGSYQNRARQYAPKLKRFLQRDPIGIRGGLNGYEYVAGAPVGAVDPTGLYTIGVEGGAGGIIFRGGGSVAIGAHVGVTWPPTIAFTVTWCFGLGAGLGGGATIGITITDADDVSDLGGESTQISGVFGLGKIGGVTFILPPPDGTGPKGGKAEVGPGAGGGVIMGPAYTKVWRPPSPGRAAAGWMVEIERWLRCKACPQCCR